MKSTHKKTKKIGKKKSDTRNLARDENTKGKPPSRLAREKSEGEDSDESSSDRKSKIKPPSRLARQKRKDEDSDEFREKRKSEDKNLSRSSLEKEKEEESEESSNLSETETDRLLPLPSKEDKETDLEALLHFSKPNPFLKGRRDQIRLMLESLVDDLGCSFKDASEAKTNLYDLTESKLKRLKQNLDIVLNDNKDNPEQAFSTLLSTDNPIGRILLLNPDAFRKIVEKLPNTEETHKTIEDIENSLVQRQDAAEANGKMSKMPLTVATHQICFEKKTAILEDVIEKMVSDSEKPKLSGLKKLGKENYWKILIDGKEHKNNNKHFYDRSKGYMASMMKGLAQIVQEIDRPLDTDFVKELHRSATELVTNESVIPDSFPIATRNFQETGIKQAPNSWGVTKQYTENGMKELKALRDDLDISVEEGYFSDDVMRFADREPDTVVQWKAGKQSGDNLKNTVEALMDSVIEKAYEQIETAGKNEDAIIGVIVDCCRGLGIIHPFKDANGRLIMFLVLNKMLLENEMSPTILEDQGFMVGKSKEELVKLIKGGQRQVQSIRAKS